MDITTTKQKQARFGRAVALLLNRGMMYQKHHPMVKDSIKEVFRSAQMLFETISPLVFILNREQFYVDEEPLDPRINVKRIANLFEKNGIQSVSFEKEMTLSELGVFIGIFSTLTTAKDADDVKKELFAKGAFNIQVNHVIYKKVTEDDQIVSREALKNVTPDLDSDDQESRKRFMETLLESVLTEEFAKTLNIQSLIADPGAVSRSMIEADLASANRTLADTQQNETLPDPVTIPDSDGPSDGEGGGPGMGAGAGPGGSGSSGTGPGGSGAGPGMGDGAGPGAGGAGQGFLRDAGPGAGGAGPGRSGAGPGMGDGAGPGAGGAGQGFLRDAGPGAGSAGPGRSGAGPGMGDGAGPGAGSADPSAGDVGAAGPGGAGPGGGSDTGADAGIGMVGAASTSAPGVTSATGHGPMLMHQLDIMHQEVEKHIRGEGEVSLEDLANAIFEMKKELFEGLETQKTLGVAYDNEAQIIQSANQLTDKVILQLIKDEYSADPEMPIKRLALIITRLVPEAIDLKRLLPKIKQVLINQGMPLAHFLNLIQELKNELKSDELARVLQESSDTIGVDSQGLLNEIKQNPDQAAKLIYLASEIRKGTGDESALSDILVDYVEQMAMDAAQDSSDNGDIHIEKVVSDVESTILKQLGKMNVDSNVLLKMEDRINERMESVLDKMRVEWLKSRSAIRKTDQKSLSVLQTFEHNVGDDEDLGNILKTVRAKVEAGEIEENNFSQIQAEINRQSMRLKAESDSIELPDGVLKPDELIFVLDKEIARANRYDAPFSALAFSLIKAKPKMKSLAKVITTEAVMVATLEKLSSVIREVDYIAQIGNNKMVALLPMLDDAEAKKALSRVMNLFHAEPLKVHGVPVQLRLAGVSAAYDSEQKLDAQGFAKQITNQLMDMVARVKNIQVLF